MFVFLKVLCVRLFTSAIQIVEPAQTVSRHLKFSRTVIEPTLARQQLSPTEKNTSFFTLPKALNVGDKNIDYC